MLNWLASKPPERDVSRASIAGGLVQLKQLATICETNLYLYFSTQALILFLPQILWLGRCRHYYIINRHKVTTVVVDSVVHQGP